MSLAKLGQNHLMFDLKHSEETKVKMSLVLSLENHSLFGKAHSEKTKLKISLTKGTATYLYNNQGSFVNIFSSAVKAGENLNVSYHTILKYAKSEKLFKNEWILSTSLIPKE